MSQKDRELRKQLLQLKSTLERAELSEIWHDVKRASQPNVLLKAVLPSFHGKSLFNDKMGAVLGLFKKHPLLSSLGGLVVNRLKNTRLVKASIYAGAAVGAWQIYKAWQALKQKNDH